MVYGQLDINCKKLSSVHLTDITQNVQKNMFRFIFFSFDLLHETNAQHLDFGIIGSKNLIISLQFSLAWFVD